MVSIIIAIVISILVGVAFGFIETSMADKVLNFLVGSLGTFLITFLIVLFVGVFNAPLAGYKDCSVLVYENGIYYMDGNNLKKIDSESCGIISEDIKDVTYRINSYDNTVFFRADSYQLIIPEIDFENKK